MPDTVRVPWSIHLTDNDGRQVTKSGEWLIPMVEWYGISAETWGSDLLPLRMQRQLEAELSYGYMIPPQVEKNIEVK